MGGAKLTARFVVPVKRGVMNGMKDFYGAGLGFQLTDAPGFLLGDQGGECLFVCSDGKNAKSSNAVISIEIAAGFGVYCQHLKECGAVFEEVARMSAGYFAHLRDPSNNLISLNCGIDDPESDDILSSWREFNTRD